MTIGMGFTDRTLTCFMGSLSRSVTVESFSVSWSIVTAAGIPTSSARLYLLPMLPDAS